MYIKTILKYFNRKKASLNQNSLVKDRTKMVMPLTASFYFLELHNVPKIQTVVIWKTVEGYLCHFGYSTLFTTNIRLRPTRTFHIHDLSHPFCIPIVFKFWPNYFPRSHLNHDGFASTQTLARLKNTYPTVQNFFLWVPPRLNWLNTHYQVPLF